jgi:lipopolysaccharide biosynthesis glycosyltransferase
MEKANAPSRFAVCLSADRNMMVPALFVASAVRSMRQSSSPPFDVILFAESAEVTDLDRQWLVHNDIKLDESLDMGRVRGIANLPNRLTIATTAKLLIPEHLAGRYEKLLLLDADLTIHDDVSIVFELDTDEYPLAAVSAGRVWASNSAKEQHDAEGHFRALGMSEPFRFFNSGVLYIDVEKWNRQKVGIRAIEFIRTNPDLCFLPDEHALNAVLDGGVGTLSPIWNARPPSQSDEMFRAATSPVIVHHMGPVKPWKRFGYGTRLVPDRSAYRMYEDFLAGSPWPNWLREQWTYRDVWKSVVFELRVFSRLLRGRPARGSCAQRRAYVDAVKKYYAEERFLDVEQGIVDRKGFCLRLRMRHLSAA